MFFLYFFFISRKRHKHTGPQTGSRPAAGESAAALAAGQPRRSRTWMTKSRPRKSAMVLGSRVRPHTKRRKRERSVLEKDSITSQNHWVRDADGSTPLYVATDLRRCRGISGLPHTCERTHGQGGDTSQPPCQQGIDLAFFPPRPVGEGRGEAGTGHAHIQVDLHSACDPVARRGKGRQRALASWAPLGLPSAWCN